MVLYLVFQAKFHRFFFNLSQGYSKPDPPHAPTFQIINNQPQIQFNLVNKTNGFFTGNYDSSATISKYIGEIIDSATNNVVKTFETTSSQYVVTGLPSGKYYAKLAAINLVDTSSFSTQSNVLTYFNPNNVINGNFYPDTIGIFYPKLPIDIPINTSQQISYQSNNPGYVVDSVFINGVYVDSPASYTFNFGNAPSIYLIYVKFKVKTINLRVSVPGNGSVQFGNQTAILGNPLNVNLPYNSKVQLKFLPNSGYFFTNLIETFYDGTTSENTDSTQGLTINNLTQNIFIQVIFQSNYVVSASVSGGFGTVTPVTQNVTPGGSASFETNPADGYEVSTIRLNGNTVVVDNKSSFSVPNITKNSNLIVTFSPTKVNKPIVSSLNNQFVTVNNVATFKVSASPNGYGTLSYQWYRKNYSATNYAMINGANANVYSFQVHQNDSGSMFKVTVYNTFGVASNIDSNTSNASTLSVLVYPQAPSITQQPQNGSVHPNNSITLNVAATVPLGTLTYQWQALVNGGAWYDLSTDVYSGQYIFTPTTTDQDQTQIRVIVSNTINNISVSTISQTATISVPAEESTSKDITISIIGGVIAGLLVIAAVVIAGVFYFGAGELSLDLADAIGYIVAAVSLLFVLAIGASILSYEYGKTAVQTGEANDKDPGTNYDIPSIYIQPQNTIVAATEIANFFVAASVSDMGTLSYQWQYTLDTNNFTNFTNNGNKANLSISNPSAYNGYYFRVLVSNNHGSTHVDKYSKIAKLTISNIAKPIINTVASNGGTITPSTQVDFNTNFIVYFKPDTGLMVSQVVIDDSILSTVPANNQYIFNNITRSHTILVIFKPKVVTITMAIHDDQNNVSYKSFNSYFGNNIRINIPSYNKYIYNGYRINGGQTQNDSTIGYTFYNLTTNQLIDVYYTVRTFNVFIYARYNGKDSLLNTTKVIYDDTLKIPLKFSPEFFIVNGCYLGNNYFPDSITSFTLYNITSDKHVYVNLSSTRHNIHIVKTYDSGFTSVVLQDTNFTLSFFDSFTIQLNTNNPNLYINTFIINQNQIYNALNLYTIRNTFQDLNINIQYYHNNTYVLSSVYLNNLKLYDSFIRVNYFSNYRVLFNNLKYSNSFNLNKVNVNNNVYQNVALDSTIGYTFYKIQTPQYISQYYQTDSVFNFITYKKIDYKGNIYTQIFPVKPGDNLQLTYSPSDSSAVIDTILIDNLVRTDSLKSFTFNNVRENHTIEVREQVKQFQVKVNLSSLFYDGHIEYKSDSSTAPYNGNFQFNFTINQGYNIYGVYINNDFNHNLFPDSSRGYTFYNIKENKTLNVDFAYNAYTIYTHSNFSNTIDNTTFAFAGQNKFIKFKTIGFLIDSVRINGILTQLFDTATGVYLPNISNNQFVDLYLSQVQYTITTSSNIGGFVSPNINIYNDSPYTVYFIPYSGYYIDSLIIKHQNGTIEYIKLPIGHKYDINSLTENINFRVVFRPLLSINIITNDSVFTNLNKFFNINNNTYYYDKLTTVQDSAYLYYPENDTVSVSFVATNKTTIDSVKIDNEIRLNIPSKSYNYIFNTLNDNHKIQIFASSLNYKIHATSLGNGTIYPEGDTILQSGSNIRYSFKGNLHFVPDSVWVDGQLVDSTQGYTFNNLNAAHTIVVKFDTGYHNIIILKNGGIKNEPDTVRVLDGDSIRITYKPDTNFLITNIVINGTRYNKDSLRGYTFKNVRGDSVITLYLTRATNTIHASAGPNGDITPSGDSNVVYNQSVLYTFLPNPNYYVDSVFVNGNFALNAIENYTFYNVDTTQTIFVNFTQIPAHKVKITANSFTGGQLLPQGNLYFDTNATVKFIVQPDYGYSLDSLIINDTMGVKDSLFSYTFDTLKTNQKIAARFKPNIYRVSTIAGTGGTIDTSNNYLYLSKVTVNFYPNKGFQVDSVWVNNIYVNSKTNYTIDTLKLNTTIRVSFKLQKFMIHVLQPQVGSITPMRDTMISYFDTITYKITTPLGYFIDSLLVNNILQPSDSILILFNILQPTVIRAVSSDVPLGKRKISLASNYGGALLPRVGTFYVTNDTSLRILVDTFKGYSIDSMLVNGKKVDSLKSYTIDTVKMDYAVQVYFKLNVFKITTSSSIGGIISADTSISSIDSVRITFQPNSNYFIDSVFVNGIFYPDSNSGYTFKNINFNQSIRVVFSPFSSGSRILSLRAFIEGYFDGISRMKPVLYNSYQAGCLTCNADTSLADSIEVSFKDRFSVTMWQTKVVLTRDGYANMSISNQLANGNYYIIIKPRNAIGVWSATPVTINAKNTFLNFTSTSSTTYGNNVVLLNNGLWALYSGSVYLNSLGISLDDVLKVKNDNLLYIQGYVISDINGDGVVTNDDLIITNKNFQKIIEYLTPFNYY